MQYFILWLCSRLLTQFGILQEYYSDDYYHIYSFTIHLLNTCCGLNPVLHPLNAVVNMHNKIRQTHTRQSGFMTVGSAWRRSARSFENLQKSIDLSGGQGKLPLKAYFQEKSEFSKPGGQKRCFWQGNSVYQGWRKIPARFLHICFFYSKMFMEDCYVQGVVLSLVHGPAENNVDNHFPQRSCIFLDKLLKVNG